MGLAERTGFGPSPGFHAPSEGVESQLDVSTLTSGTSGGTSWGQRLTISNRTVTKLSFYLKRDGSPGGTVTFLIRKVSDDSIVATKLWGNAIDISTTATWYEITFGTPVFINEEVRLLVSANLGSAGNLINVYSSHPNDVKAGEYIVNRNDAGVYTAPYGGVDFGYIYTYT